jgi:hypothetical protein
MKKILLSIFLLFAIVASNKTSAQCDLAIANLVISPAADPVQLTLTKCEYKFNASFDITTNSGFKYLFFHSWLASDYPNPALFNCGGSTPAADPGTALQLGTAIDQAGKSILDFGFINLNSLTFPAGVMVDVSANIATGNQYPNNSNGGIVALNTAQSAYITRSTTDPNVLHFEINGLTVVVAGTCGTAISVKTDIWGSNANGSGQPGANSKIKAQCYICGLQHTFNDPTIALTKHCTTAPFGYEVGLTTSNTIPLTVQYKVYMDNLDQVKQPGTSDPLIYTSGNISLSASTPYNSGVVTLPNPYCCVDPWAQYGIYVEVTIQGFANSIGSVIVEEACATLPIKLRSFTAARNRSEVLLKWETETEENSKEFAVQRKLGNGPWVTVGNVQSKAINGTSTLPLSYEYTDYNNTKGVSQYRLKQIDLDSKSAFSPIRSVRGDGQKGKTIVYPNPSSDGKINIVFEDAGTVRDVSVMDMSGRMIRQWKGITNNNIQMENLNAGFYSVRIVNAETGEQVVEKFVVNKR